MSKRDYYEVLGVAKTATDSDLKSAYRKLAMKFHPDRNPGDKAAEESFKEAAEAYAVLADPQKRSLYDRFGHQGVSQAAGAGGGFDPSVFNDFGDFADILGGMFGFGDMFGGRRRGGPQRGADLRYDLEISFEEAAKGAETSIQIPRQENCETCNGSGAAPGTQPTTCTMCRGQGQVRRQQGFFTIATTCPQCRGAGRTVAKPCQTCHGSGRVGHERKITVKIPAGIATGQQLRLQNEGEAGIGGGPAGHLYVVVHVQDHDFFKRDGVNLFCEVPVNFTTRGTRRRDRRADARRHRDGEGPRRHADRHHHAAARQGDARRERTRQGRPVRDRAGADAEEAEQGTATAARAACEGAARRRSSSRARTPTRRTSATCSTA